MLRQLILMFVRATSTILLSFLNEFNLEANLDFTLHTHVPRMSMMKLIVEAILTFGITLNNNLCS